MVFSPDGFSVAQISLLYEKGSKFLMRPLLCLLYEILREDTEVQEWFSKWLRDVMNYQKEEM